VGDLSADEELFLLSHSEHGDSRNRALRILDLEGATVAELWDGRGKGLHLGRWSPVPGDRRVVVGHEREGPIRPLLWHPQRREVTELAIDLPGEILDGGWYPDGSALLLQHYWQGRGELYRYELGPGRAERLEIGRGIAGGAQVRPDGEIWYGFSSSASPPEVRTGSRILLRPPGEPAPCGVAYRDLWAGEVHAFVAEPPSPRPHATVFRVHGGPEGMDADSFSPAVQAWVDHGFAVVMVNYRGSFGYGKAWREAILANVGFQELEDIAAVQDHVVAEGIGDASRMVLAGGSWGGYLTLLGAGTQPQRWALGIASVPLGDLAHAYQDAAEPLKEYDRALFGGTPEEVPEQYRKRSPVTYAADVRAPLLIVAGRNDPRCPIAQVQSYAARLAELGKEYELYEYDAGHGSFVVDEQIRQTELALGFAARHLGTPEPL
jgi:pimeloyl-ACP methyl ester carboxylesterase